MQTVIVFSFSRRLFLLVLPRNRLRVLANDVVVASLPIVEIGTNDKHVAGEAKREQSLIRDFLLPGQSWSTDALAGIRERPRLMPPCGPSLESFSGPFRIDEESERLCPLPGEP